MSIFTSAIVAVRSQIAASIARYSPKRYKQIIERRHPGVRLVADGTSDVRELKDQCLEYVMRALETLNLEVLAKIDDRNCWVLLVSSGDDPDDPERLVLKLLEYGLRLNVAMEGRRTKRITNQARLERLKKTKPLRISSIRAGIVWMRARHRKNIGWHSATRIHFYDRDDATQTFFARRSGGLPPRIGQVEQNDPTITGVSRAENRLDKIRFPIDVVYTWVDGDDDAWNEKRQRRAAEESQRIHKVANSRTRYINRDELRYSLRSLYYYAPWVRNIYLVTDDQVPEWFDASCEGLEIITHKELFPDPDVLPTFNSHAIESVLHRIPGLSEHFIYMNDDVFLSSTVHPESFFEVSGIARTFLSRSMIPFCSEDHSDIASEWGLINANKLLSEAHGTIMPYKTKHTPLALRKSLLESLESRYSEHFEQLRRSPFRTKRDLAPTSSLHTCFGLAEGMVVRGSIAYRYLNLARPDLEQLLDSIAFGRHAMVYCLNDTEIDDHADFDWSHQEQAVISFLKMMYPYQAPWEKAESNGDEP